MDDSLDRNNSDALPVDSFTNTEAEFKSLTQFNELSPEAILKELAELKASLEPLNQVIKEASEAKDAFNDDIKIHQEQINLLKQKQNDIDREVWDKKKSLRDLERKIESATRRFQEASHNRELQQQYRALSDEFDRITMGAPWREFAMDHQITGAKRLAAEKRAILADKRGLGKTLTSLVYCDMVQSRKVIAVMPNDTQDNFMRELHHWAPHRAPTAVKIGGLNKSERGVYLNLLLPQLDDFFIVINYEAWRRDKTMIDSLVKLQPDTLILDEAHVVKNRSTKAFQGIKKIITATNKCSNPACKSGNIGFTENYYGGVSNVHCRDCGTEPKEFFEFNSTKHVLPMTGTPILNRPQDLFSLLNLIDPKVFHTEQSFLFDYCTQSYYDNKWRFRPGGLDSLTKKLASRFIMRDRHTAGIVIPPQEIQILNLTLTPDNYPEQYRTLKALTEQAMLILDQSKGEALAIPYLIALITRKRQATVYAKGIEFKDREGNVVFTADCNESIKLDRVIPAFPVDENSSVTKSEEEESLLLDMIGEYNPQTKRWEDGERVVVFSAFNAPLEELKRRCERFNIPVAMMTGETTNLQRDSIVQDFDAKVCSRDNYKYQVVLCNYAVGGVGLNLTGASQIICLDEIWSPGKQDQAYGRIDRIGQTKETGVTILRVNNSIDQFMADLIELKADIIEGFESKIDLQQKMTDFFNNEDNL